MILTSRSLEVLLGAWLSSRGRNQEKKRFTSFCPSKDDSLAGLPRVTPAMAAIRRLQTSFLCYLVALLPLTLPLLPTTDKLNAPRQLRLPNSPLLVTQQFFLSYLSTELWSSFWLNWRMMKQQLVNRPPECPLAGGMWPVLWQLQTSDFSSAYFSISQVKWATHFCQK